jgi:hypothetical protein
MGTYDTFGKPAAGTSPELDDLSAFVTSLDKFPKSPFRNPDGSYTNDALEGRKIFDRAGCADCHSGPDFTDSPAGMVHDVGTILPTSGHRLGGPLTATDTPQLKGVWQTAPYLHDGRAATLLEIFTKYLTKDEMGTTSDLTPTELGQLVEYLQELDDVPETPVAPPPRPHVAGGISCAASPSFHRSSRASVTAWFFAWVVVFASKRRRSKGHRHAAPPCREAGCASSRTKKHGSFNVGTHRA